MTCTSLCIIFIFDKNGHCFSLSTVNVITAVVDMYRNKFEIYSFEVKIWLKENMLISLSM